MRRIAERIDKGVAVVLAMAAVSLLMAGVAYAISSHDPWKLREGRNAGDVGVAVGQCENCHTLNTTEGEPNTSYINETARTLPMMRAFGVVSTGNFGCTFCHSSTTDNIYMKDGLLDYQAPPAGRKHPVGINLSGTENFNEYFSTFSSTGKVDQLDCMDCHDPSLLYPGSGANYPYHEGRPTDPAGWTGTWDKAVNPYALRSVTALGDERSNHCVNTCHGDLGGGNGVTKPQMGHLGWGAYNGTTLFEPRGQALLQSNCGVCHDTHSSNKDKLISDGTGVVVSGVNGAPDYTLQTTAETAINTNDCTLTCHVGRNAASDYRTKGHGKAQNRELTVNMNYSYTGCTPCHTSSVDHRDSTNPKRFGFTEDTAMAGLPHFDGSANGLDDNYSGTVDEAAENGWTQPQVSICQGCHTTYYAHSGAITGTTTNYKTSSCLDCHDPHGKGVGANIEMIRTTIAGEATTFQNTSDMAGTDDFYRNWGGGDRNGVCDNIACHGRDLAAILNDNAINDHAGVQPGDNCLGCHVHASSNGEASFKPNCNICHGNPPATGGLPDYSQGIGVHARHVTQLGIGCEECHYRNGLSGNTHNETAWTEPTGIPVPRTNVDVVFNTHGGTVNMNATYSGYNYTTRTMDGTIGAVHTCDNVTCHNPDSGTAGTGLTGKNGATATNNVVSWADAFATISSCTDPDGAGPLLGCHVESPATNPDNGSHYKHDNGTGGKGFPCQTCHFTYYDAGNIFGTATGNHGNFTLQTSGIVDVNTTLGAESVTGVWSEAANTCSAVYCHGSTLVGGGGDQLLPVWGPGASRAGGLCGDCHNTDPTSDTVAPQDYMSTGNHIAHLNAPQGPNTTCSGCHPAYAPTSASHVNGAKDFLNLDNTTVATFAATDACSNCHGTSVANAKNATNWATNTFKLGCLECHDGVAKSARTGGVSAPKEDTYWTANGHGRTTAYNATLHGQAGPGYACTICHDQTAAHINGTLGDHRFLAVADDGFTYTSKVTEVCLDCHKVGQVAAPAPVNHLGYDASAEASIHSGVITGNYNTVGKAAVAFPAYGNAADYTTSPGYQCEACHNPHGTSKLAMTKATIDGALGSPAQSNPVAVGAGFDAANLNLTGLDPTAAANDGVCDACHRSTVNTNAHPDTTKINDHNQGQNCMSCHDHKTSFKSICNNCHGDIGGAVRGDGTFFPPEGPVASRNPGGQNWAETNVAAASIGHHQKHVVSYGTIAGANGCVTCHTATPGIGATHNDNGINATLTNLATYGTWAQGTAAGTVSVVDDTCANITCHASTYGTPANTYRSAANPGYVRYWNSNLDCYSCHAYNGAADSTLRPGDQSTLTADWIASGSHDVHINKSTGYTVACTECHPSGAYTNTHKDGSTNFVTNFGATRLGANLGGNYDDNGTAPYATLTPVPSAATSQYYCGNVYCHSTGEPRGAEALVYSTARWANAGTADCGDCHAVDAAVGSMTTNVHEKHTGAAAGQYTYRCEKCHSGIVAWGGAVYTVSDRALHVNNTNNVNFGTNEGTYAAGVAPAGGGCSAVYCHSQGLDWTAPYTTAANAPLITADWDSAAGSLGCSGCHGDGAAVAYPTYVNNLSVNPGGGAQSKRNSHARHAGYTCDNCHSATTTTGTTITTPTNHTDKTWQVAQGGSATFTVSVPGNMTANVYTPTSCVTISCHGGGGAQWGSPLGCGDCHFAAADVNDWNIANGTMSKIASAEWTTAGHGRTTVYPDGNPAASLAGPASGDPQGCAYCHSFVGSAQNPLVLHGVAANPFRLANLNALGNGTAAANGFGWNDVCLVCHRTGDAGYDPDGVAATYASRNGTVNVDENHYGTHHTAGTQGGTFCWDCHDPHGDAQHKMVQLTVADVSDGAYGVPASTRAVTGMDVATGGYTSGDLANAANTGLCQTCHASSGGAMYYNRGLFTALASHNGADTTLCTACHPHSKDFAPICINCHGDIGRTVRNDGTYYPPEGPIASRNPGGQNWVETTATAATIGHHQKHVTSYGTSSCTTCHTATPGFGGTHNDNGANATMTGVATYGAWATGTAAGTTSVVDDTCANISCHASTYGTPANAYLSPANPGYVRYWNSNLDCYSCHAYNGAADSGIRPGDQSTLTSDWMASGSHDVHINKSTGYTVACTECHPSGAYTNTHKSGSVNFVTNFGATRLGANLGGNYDTDGSGPYTTVTPTPSAATSQYYCGNVYCHSTGEPRGGEALAYSNARWANAGTADCGDCHAVDAAVGSMTTNVHEKHTGSVAGQYTYRCEKCHSGIVAWGGAVYTVSDRALHVNNTNNVNFGTNEGTYATGAAPAGGDCSAVYCHSQGLDWTAPYVVAANAPLLAADWDSAPGALGCSGCHGNGAAIAYPTYANNLSVNPGGGAQAKKNSHAAHAVFTCNQCHNATTTTGTTITTATNHTNKAWDLAQGGTSTFTVSVQGNMTANAYTATTCANINCHSGGTAQWGAVLSCGDCHFAAADTNDWNISNGTISKVASTEWTTAGHGRTSAYPDGNPAAGFVGPAGSDPQGCAYCHSFVGTAQNPLVTHQTAGNPFRLANLNALGNGTGAANGFGWNDVCLVCHRTGDAGYDPDGGTATYSSRNGTVNVDENHYGTHHIAGTQGGTFCWDCHDPHGDAQHKMVHLTVTDVSDGAYGAPASTRTVTGLDVTAGGYTSGDLANAANTGLCQTCHASSGGANYYNRGLFTALASHNGADTSLCTACHPHARDFAPICVNCHGDIGGAVRGDNTYYPPEGPTASRNPGGQNWQETSATAATVGHHQRHVQSYGTTACSTCHTATPGLGGTHNDNGTNATMTGVATYGAWGQGAAAGVTSVVDDSCANITCHASTYGTPANTYRSPANPGYVRYWNSNLDCYSCHAYNGAADSGIRPGDQSTLTSDWMASGSHDAHINKSTGYTVACTECHPSGAYTNTHKSGSVNFVTNFGATRLGANLGGNYDDNGTAPYTTLTPVPSAATSQYYCGNVYCHSTGEPRGAAESIVYSNARWANAGTADCGDCHAVDAAVGSMTTNVHEKHTGSTAGQYTYRCEKCHSGIVAWGGAVYTVSDRALHVNNTNNVNFGTNEGTYAAGAAPVGGDCSAVYCHSQGLDWTAPYTAVANAPLLAADWDSAAGSLNCYGCHGDGAAIAYPTYANNLSVNPGGGAQTKKNSHARHAAFTCNLCHNATTTTGNTITTPTNHTNKAWDLAQGGSATFTVSVQGNMTANAYTATSCTNISCHGSGTAQWGATLACGDCHGRSTAGGGDLNDWNISNGTLSRINTEEWTSAGHGRTTAYPGGNAAASFAGPAGSDPQGCAYCHSFLGTAQNPIVNHQTAANPFRLANKGAVGTVADQWNQVCLVCHKASDTGYDPDGGTATYANINGTRNVDENHYGANHSALTQGGGFCWDCHDPHGDGQHKMVHSGDGSAAGLGVTDVSDGAYGVPASSRTVTGLDVTAGGYTSGDLANAANTGLCQTCHAASGGASYFTRSLFTPLASHNGADVQLCTTCHLHTRDFSPVCNNCHGDIGGAIRGDDSYYPPEGPVAARNPGGQNWAETSATPATVGHHQKHTQSYGLAACTVCHTATPGNGGTHNDNGTNATMTGIATYGAWGQGAAAGVTSVVDDTCANMTCHTSTYGTPANTYRSPANPAYVRYWNSNLDCYSCHAYNGAADSGIRPGDQSTLTSDWMASGSHDAHINKSTGYTVACTECHPSGAYTNTHKSGSVNFVTNFGATRLGANLGGNYDDNGTAPYTTLTPVPSAATSQYYCGNVYCHSTGEPRGAAESIVYSNARWANAGTADCGDCHAVDAAVGSMTTNVHEKHTGSTAGQYTYRCEKCHSGIVAWGGAAYTVSDRALHVNNTNNVNFGTNEGTYATGTAPAGGDCSAVYCHSQGLDWTAPYTTAANAPLLAADWDSGAASLGCYGCHGDGVTVAYPTYANNLSVNPGGGAQTKKNSHAKHGAYTCNQCHNATTTTGNTITTLTNHANKAWDLAQGGTSTFTVSVQGSMAANVYTATTCTAISCHNGGTAQWGAALQCTDCHFAVADVNDWNITNGTPAAISSTEWTSAGHGRTTVYPGGNPAAGFAGPGTDTQGCAYCHSFVGTAQNPLVNHGVAANPFRLANLNALGNGIAADNGFGWNDVCLVCHRAGDAGYDPDGATATYASRNGTLNVDENHYGVKHTLGTQGGTFCWDCHDPHGDAQHKMMHLTVTDVTDGAYGAPASTRALTGLDVATGGYTSDDLANAANTGLCQTCHAAAGGANYYTRSLFTPLTSHNGASGTRCTSCHLHSKDFAAGCTTCHGDISGLIRGDGSYFPPEGPIASRNAGGQNWVETNATPATVGHHQTHVQSYGTAACSTCHTATPGNGITHNDGGVNATMSGIATYGTWAAGALAGTTSVVDDTCANMTCHTSTYGAPANTYRSAANPGYVRYWNRNLDCYSCHAYNGAADSAIRPGDQSTLTSDWIATGSHDAHINKSTGYTVACTECHPSGAYTNTHKDGSTNFVTNFGATRLGANLGGNYDDNGTAPYATLTPVPSAATGQYYCGNVYCHSTGEPRGAAESIVYSNARWANAGTADCGDCHAVDAAVGSMTTNVHEKHTGSTAGQYTYRCEKCHSGIVAWGGAAYTVSDRALHVNNTNNVNFGTNEGTYAAGAAPAGGDCSAVYCHSQGLDWTAPYTTAANAPLLAADWDSGAASLGCYGCHGDGAAITYPTYANNLSVNPGAGAQTKKNSHAVHGGYTCNNCHNATTTTGTTITTLTNHANKVWDLAQGGIATFTVSVQGSMAANVYTPTSCTNINCHGGGTAQWGGSLVCGDCHNAAADVNDWNITNGTIAKISSTEWTTAGHGRTAAYPGGNPAAGFAGPVVSDPQGCAYCHSFVGTAQNPLVTHNAGANPFRLANLNALGNGTAADNGFGWNDVCLVCHRTGDAGYDPDGGTANYSTVNGTRDVDENHYGSSHAAGTQGGTFCWDCHDPHGDAQHKMVQLTVTDVTDGAYGAPASTRAVTGFDVTAGGYTSGDLANAANTGLCQTCHAAAGGASYFNRGLFTPLASHNGADAQLCTTCHLHTRDFSAGCTTCHGDIGGAIRADGSFYPPEGPVASRNPGGQNWVETNATAATVGHHLKHTKSYGTTACSSCHTPTPGAGVTHNDNGVNATMTGIATYGTWAAGALAGTTSVVDDTCANMTCHSSTYGTPANTYRSAANPGYVRYWNSNLDCYSCHAYNGAADSGIRPGDQSTLTSDWIATGSHDAHINKSTGYTVACTECHPSGAYTNTHKDGSTNFVTNFGATRLGANLGGNYDDNGTAPYATLTPVPSAATGQYYCGNVYCHSTGEPRGGEALAYSNARWANAGTADCGDCHAVDAAVGSMTTNVHEKHTGSTAGQYTYRCEKCHSGIVAWGGAVYTVSDRALHVNNTNNVNFGTNEGTYATGAAPVGGDCSAVYCHSQGLDWTAPYTTAANAPLLVADWDSGAASLGCYGCHGDGAAVAYPTYANNLSVNPGAGAQTKKNSHARHSGYTCDFCHSATTTTGATITTLTNHANKAWDLAQGGSAVFTVSVQGNMAANVYTPTSCTNINCHNGGTAQWGATLQCSDCHFAAADVNDWNIANGTASAISSTEWTAAGHGRASAYPGGNAAASFAGPATDSRGCAYCHSFVGSAENPLVTHGVGTNPFRLANLNALGNGVAAANGFGWNDVCLVCHRTGDAGYDPDGAVAVYASRNGTLNVDENHYGTHHTAGTQGGTFCWDCHDPHGDANHLMVHATVTDVSDGAYGAPASSRAVTGLDVTAGGYASDDLANAANTGLCQTCHAAAAGAAYYNRGLFTALSSHNGANGTLCTVCHPHTRDFAPILCEDCHDATPFVRGTATAPNVMGTGGTLAGASGSPYDNGTYGYNVNGHGRDADTASVSHGNAIAATCANCHDLSQPAGAHIDGTLNGRITPTDTRNANSFHLLAGFIKATPTSEWDVQKTFDDYCWTACHNGTTTDMRHALDSTPAANAVEFGSHLTYAQPANAPPPIMFIDRNLKTLGAYDGAPDYAPCVSCHDPHGTNIASPRADLNNKMMLYRWSNPTTLCAQCHL